MGKALDSAGTKAIVLGNNLSVVQDLGVEGVDCVVMNHHRAIATYSRYARYVQCPDPSHTEDKAIEFLYQFCAKEGDRPVVFPVTDQWSMAVSKHADRLREVSIPCTATEEVVDLMLHKERFIKWCSEKGIRTPRSWTLEEVHLLTPEEYPIIVKPKRHRWSSNGDPLDLHNEMVRLRNSPIGDKWELEKFLQKEKKFIEHLFFQEYVAGGSDLMYNIGMYVDGSHDVVASMAGHKIRGCMTNHGDTNVGENVSPPGNTQEVAESIVKELGYTGVVEFEFKQDPRTHELVLIEVNPHFWAWCGMGTVCGINFPMIAYQDLTGTLDPSTIVPYQGRVRYARAVPDLINCMIYSRMGANTPKCYLPQWWVDMGADRFVSREFTRRDCLVSVLLIEESVRELLKRTFFFLALAIRRPFQRLSAKYPQKSHLADR